MSLRGIIKKSNVAVICTTDDPSNDLKWHEQIKNDASFTTKVYPAMRPDTVVNIEKSGWREYLTNRLAKSENQEIKSYDNLLEVLKRRIDYFDKMGCRAADHGVTELFCQEGAKAPEIFKKALGGEALTPEEIAGFKTALLLFFASEYQKRG